MKILDVNPARIIERLERRVEVADQIHKGLSGSPFRWSGEEEIAIAADVRATLLTETAIRDRGLRLKRGAQPVGYAVDSALYVLQCQTAILLPDMKPAQMRKKLYRSMVVGRQIVNGLGGKKYFTWGSTEALSSVLIAGRMGATLLTETAIKKRGLRLKREAQPVGIRYYSAPLCLYADLYVMECQTMPEERKAHQENMDLHQEGEK